MKETVASINSAVNNFVWGVPAMILIMGVGLYLAVRTRFVQLRKFGLSMRETLGKVFTKKKDAQAGAVTPFQAVCTALAATVGTGNIAGVAGAIAIGGPGAVFWMWISALLGMGTKMIEVTLAVHYRKRNEKGDWVGGPMYSIEHGLGKKWKWLACIYAGLGLITVFGTGNATQVNTIISSINSVIASFSDYPADGRMSVNLLIGIVIAAVIAVVLLGGIKRIGTVTERLVPFMALLYVVLGLGVILLRVKNVPQVFGMIFEGAFKPSAVTGGIIGSMFLSMKKGVSRGIFSNEAGLGTAAIAHSSTETEEPVQQGLYGIFEVFVDTIIICTMTALVILLSGVEVKYGEAAGAPLTISGFQATYGSWISIITAIAMISFAFSTILGWGLYGTRCFEYLFGSKYNKPFMAVYSLVAIVGATMELGLLWDIVDTFNGLMVIPNLIGVALLSPVAFRLIRDYFKEK